NANADLLRKEDPNQAANGFGIEMDGLANSNTYFAGWKNGTSQQCWTTAPFTLTPTQWQLVAVVYNQATAGTKITPTVYVTATLSTAAFDVTTAGVDSITVAAARV